MALVTLATYKTDRGITGTAFDTPLQRALDVAHAKLRRYCGRSLTDGFESATREEDYETDGPTLFLREWPVTSITSITPIDDSNGLGTAHVSTTYAADLAAGTVKLNGSVNGRVANDDGAQGWGWSSTWGRVRVVYVNTAAAADVVDAVYRLTDTVWAFRGAPVGVASHSLGNWSVTYATPEAAQAAILSEMEPYRRKAVTV